MSDIRHKISNEVLAVGDGSTTLTVELEYDFIVRRTLRVIGVVSGSNEIYTDDGLGGFVDVNGTAATGSLDYTTGKITDLTFTGPLDAVDITGSYQRFDPRVFEQFESWFAEARFGSENTQRVITALAQESQEMWQDILQFFEQRSNTQIPDEYLTRTEEDYGLDVWTSFSEEARRRRLLTLVEFIRIKGTEESFEYWFWYHGLRVEIHTLWTDDYENFVIYPPRGDTNYYPTRHFYVIFPADVYSTLGDGDIVAGKIKFNELIAQINTVKPATTVFNWDLYATFWIIDGGASPSLPSPSRNLVGGSGSPSLPTGRQIMVGGLL